MNRSLLLALTLCPLLTGASTSQALSEAQVNAALVYNFASFTEWPEIPADELVRDLVPTLQLLVKCAHS